ncbi:MAG: fluoride efflux transporter CrcB [Porticoccaceae bacterium]|jgi:fluoride exporter|nr:fluoride efflux transporter CrcB [Porticoccaceae bacterium]
MSLWILCGVALGGALGASLRYITVQLVEVQSGFPVATLIVNILGSFLIGVCYVLILEKTLISEIWRPLLMAGFLGGLTTFSAFSLEAVALFEEGRWQMALSYIVFSTVFCIVAAFSGIQITRAI